MSIQDEIEARMDEGRLVRIDPLLPDVHPRVLFARRELHDEIMEGAASADGSRAYRVGQLRSDFDLFSAGDMVTVGYGKEATCFLKCLDPRQDEVWELRSRDPKPSVRVFGRFAMTNVLIATHMAWREDLKGWRSIEWAQEIRNCKTYWRQMFNTYPPHSGASINDYISTNVIEVGHLP